MKVLILSVIAVATTFLPVAAAGGAGASASSGGWSSCDDPGYGYAYNFAGAGASAGGVNAGAGAQTYCVSYLGFTYQDVYGAVYVYDANTGSYSSVFLDWSSAGSSCATTAGVAGPFGSTYQPLGCPVGDAPAAPAILP